MKTKIYNNLTLVIILFLLLNSCKSTKFKTYNYLVSKEWQSTMQSGVIPLKEKWGERIAVRGWDWTKFYNTELSADDWDSVQLVPVPIFTLDSISFMNLAVTSNIETLMVLDEARATFYFNNKSIDKYVAFGYGKYENNEWRSNGYGGIGYSCIEVVNSVLHKNGFIGTLYIIPSPKISPNFKYGFIIFYENGKLMYVKAGFTAKPLNEAIIEFREHWKRTRANNEII